MENLRLYNVSIHKHFYQNRLINESSGKFKAKIPEKCKYGVFFVRCTIIYILSHSISIQKQSMSLKKNFFKTTSQYFQLSSLTLFTHLFLVTILLKYIMTDDIYTNIKE